MAYSTSGTTDFSIDVDQLISNAASYAGGDPTSAEELTKFIWELNMLLKHFQAKSVPVAKRNHHDFTFTDTRMPSITLPNYVSDVVNIQLVDGTAIRPIKREAPDVFEKILPKEVYGPPSRYFVERNNDTIDLYFHPRNDKVTYILRCVTLDKIEDITALAQSIDISSRFYSALVFGLASRIAEHRTAVVDANRRAELYQKADGFLAEALRDDRDRVPLKLKPKGSFK